MTLEKQLVIGAFKVLTSLICRIDAAQLEKVPRQGPLILYTNHVNLVEIPILFIRMQPRLFHSMALASRWENPLLGWLLNVAESIPLHRGEADVVAIRKGLEVLKRGEILVIAPEGTRSHDGRLQHAHPGVVLLALHSGVPLLPVVFYGAENYSDNLRRLKRTDFHLRVGVPFHLDAGGGKVNRDTRERMLEELMGQLAKLLPPQYRGYYAEQSTSTPQYLAFP